MHVKSFNTHQKFSFYIRFYFVSSWSYSAINYYSKATGNLGTLSNWGTVTHGRGVAPAILLLPVTFFTQNNATPIANWKFSGAGSKVVLGDGTNTCSFDVGVVWFLACKKRVEFFCKFL